MTATLFGYRIAATEPWEDVSVRTFVLKDDEPDAPAPTFDPLMFRAGLMPVGAASTSPFRANVVVVRERQSADGDLTRYARSQRTVLQERFPAARCLREGATEVAGVEAYEQDLLISLEHPLPALRQWHVSLVADGFFYHACCTTTQAAFDRDKPRFDALLGSWSLAR